MHEKKSYVLDLNSNEYQGFPGLSEVVGDGLTGRKFLLLGATGFVGHYTRVLLEAVGATVVLSTHQSIPQFPPGSLGLANWITLDIADKESTSRGLDSVRPDYVINAARHGFARGESEFPPMWNVNVKGVENLLDALIDHPEATLVHVGSSTEYGPSDKPMAEDHPLNPIGAFGRTKALATGLVEAWAKGFARKAGVVRPFKIYGPGEHSFRLIPSALHAVTHGVPLPLLENSRRDYIHVWDVASSIIRVALIASAKVPILNVGTGVSHSPREVIRLLEEVTGRKVPLVADVIDADPIDATEWYAETSRMQADLAWSPDVGLREGLKSWWETIS